ncbi:MAG: hypothetical protein Q4Q07_07330 [Tissierellia bacterium]|nr:hypothetical protein [Tissierellia bacterium]
MKESIKTFVLLTLSISLIFLASLVWVKFPKKPESPSVNGSEFSSTYLEREILSPKKLIVNFSHGEHTLFYEIEPMWKEYYNWMEDFLVLLGDEDNQIEKITQEEYLKAQDEMSLVFVYDYPWSTRILGNLLNVEKPKEKNTGAFKIETLYLPVKGGFIILINENKELIKVSIKHGKFQEIEERLEDLYDSKRYRNYENFWEKYKVLTNVYVPKLTVTLPRPVIYRNELAKMEKTYRNDLAERFLGRDIDYIREIIEDSGTTYVYEARNLRFHDDGLIEYQNLEEFESKEENLFVSLQTALDFIATRTGINTGLVLSQVERISTKGNSGYRLDFNLKENDKEVLLQKDPLEHYMSIEVYNQNVAKFQFLYRKAMDTNAPKDPAAPILEDQAFSPSGVLEQNVPMFYPNGTPDGDVLLELIQRVEDVDVIYVDPGREEEMTTLLPAWKIKMDTGTYIFHMGNGEFLMER